MDALAFWTRRETQDPLTTDLTDHTDEERPDLIIPGPNPRGAVLGRKTARLGRLRTQGFWVLRPRIKCCYGNGLGVAFSTLGRLGRKIPEHFVDEA